MFDFNTSDSSDGASRAATGNPSRRRRLMQRALLRWLAAGEDVPFGMAADVPTRVVRFKADLAAFWSMTRSNPREGGPSRILEPDRTMLVQCYAQRQDCWANCVQTAKILPRLQELRAERQTLQAVIRDTEPALRDPHTLFEEYAEWHYERSANSTYHEVQRQIERLEHALLEGTRFEQVRNAQVADFLYLAVPEGMIGANELTDGWGLLWVSPNLEVSVQRPAPRRDCAAEHRMHLVQNIAAAAAKSVLFANGVAGGTARSGAYLVQPPRGHRRRKQFRLT